MKLHPIITEAWKMDGGVAFGVVPKGIWAKVYPSDESNMVAMSNRLLLVQSSERLILIDTGFGEKRNEKYYHYKYIFESTPIIDAIKAVKFNPEEITDVIFTHLHDDHAGGAVERIEKDYRLVFPEATHWLSRKQYEWAANPNAREAASFFPDNIDAIVAAGKLRLVDQPGEIIPGINVLLFDGHTGGQMIPIINTDAGKIAFMADFIPSKAHIPLPYLASVDIQPLVALKEKDDFLKTAYQEGYILFFEHDFYNEACGLVKGEKGITGGETVSVSELFN